jgi:hypothetical protein
MMYADIVAACELEAAEAIRLDDFAVDNEDQQAFARLLPGDFYHGIVGQLGFVYSSQIGQCRPRRHGSVGISDEFSHDLNPFVADSG